MKQFEGRQLAGRYQIAKYLAEGNFGAVYQGRQYFLDDPVRRVAIKLSKKTGLERDTAKVLFADAFRLAEAMDEMPDAEARKHLIQVLDLGIAEELDRRGYAILEFVPGTNLAEEFSRFHGPAPSNIVVNWIVQACRGLNGLHRLVPPLLHCDLKPDNILLGLDSTVRLVDFGLSRRLLHTGMVAAGQGVIKYMAPEASQQQECTPASDVYSLGLVLYEGLTGKLPFDHLVPPPSLPHSMFNNWFDEQRGRLRVIPPSDVNNSVTPSLDQVVVRCLEFQPGKRFRSATELLAALESPGAGSGGQSPCADAILRSREHRGKGEWDVAERVVRQVLADAKLSKQQAFDLRNELANSLTAMRQHEEAAQCLVEAWNAIQDTAVLPELRERGKLLERIARSFDAAGNSFQAMKWRRTREKLLPKVSE